MTHRGSLKTAGAVGVAAQVGGMEGAGLTAGKDPKSGTGWESFNPNTQFFNRRPFQVPGPAFQPVGPVTRPSHLTDYVFGRVARFQKALEAHPEWKLTWWKGTLAGLWYALVLVTIYAGATLSGEQETKAGLRIGGAGLFLCLLLGVGLWRLLAREGHRA